MAQIAVIGAGYVGLTTAACFSSLGHDVICADIDEGRIARLQQGEIPIVEAGLEALVREGMEGGRLSFVVGAEAAARHCEFAYLCVPTPQGEDGSADLSYIEAAARQIGPVLPSEAVVVNKSTVPVGSTRAVERVLGRDDVVVVSNPEFLREGSAVHDFLNPDRIVIGSDDQSAAVRVASLYIGVTAPIIVTDPASAETIKYASNAFLATKISFVNAVAAVCEAVGADVKDVVLGMGYDSRIGHEFLKPGPGWGGSCFLGDETLLVERAGRVELVRFDRLADAMATVGADGWRVAAWRPGEAGPELLPLKALTVRPYEGDVVEVGTKMGRRVTVTGDHPFVVGDGAGGDVVDVRLAGELTSGDWLPLALGPLDAEPEPATDGDLLDALAVLGLRDDQVIVRLSAAQRQVVAARRREIPWQRRRDIERCGAMNLAELRSLGLDPRECTASTVRNGTYVPVRIPRDAAFWRIVGLWLADGHRGVDGRRMRLCWSFNPHTEGWLADEVAAYWRRLGVRADVRRGTTALVVSVSSRLLATWWVDVLGLGDSSYTKRIPDDAWRLPGDLHEALLAGLWWGDGSWSLVNGGPSVVLEYGTVSRRLADGMLRMLAGLGIVARAKTGRSARSTVDAHFLTIGGADQVERCLHLVRPPDRGAVAASVARQAKRIAPTGYRITAKNTAWVRVTSLARRPHSGPVYSVEVPEAGTVVTTGGLVAHNCFPKDSRALVHIADSAGYSFDLLRGVIAVNEDQFHRVVAKVRELVGGSLAGVNVGAWGLTFKARTDDTRDSPALRIVSLLAAEGADVRAYDPAVKGPVEGIEPSGDPYSVCDGADVLVVLTEWDEFRWLDFDKVAGLMRHLRVVDARNLLDKPALERRGFTYRGIGR
ncbi:MAG TPA: nucleotide sugar dehydrogenase [Acidimicrobiales bacterium]